MSNNDTKASPSRQLDVEYVDLLTRNRRPLFRMIFCMVRNVPDAEDVFQQTAITMWDKFGTFEQGTDFLAWASVVARFKVRDFMKSKARQRAHFSDEVVDVLVNQNTLPADQDDTRLQALESCRKKLSGKDQQLLAACYQSESTIIEVANQSGRPVGSIYDSLWRIRRALLACIRRTLASEDYT
jgi:RNA polymerase sigma-70 factor, ECF subfamily